MPLRSNRNAVNGAPPQRGAEVDQRIGNQDQPLYGGRGGDRRDAASQPRRRWPAQRNRDFRARTAHRVRGQLPPDRSSAHANTQATHSE